MHYFNFLSLILYILSMPFSLATGPLKIIGSVPELSSGKMLLVAPSVNGLDTIGIANINEGIFVLEANIDKSYVATLKVEGYEGGFFMIAEPGEEYKAELLQNGPSSISGGRLQDELLSYQNKVAKHNEKFRLLREKIDHASKSRQFKTANELNKELEIALQSAQTDLDLIVDRNRGSVLSAYLLTGGMRGGELADMEVVYSKLNDIERQTQPGLIYGAAIEELRKLKIGSVAPDFTLADRQGEMYSLHSLPGKIKIVDFWASWCGPCRLENPNMLQLHHDFGDSGLTIVSVSLDEKREPWIKAVEEDNMEWLQLLVADGWKSDVVLKYNIDSVPTIYILDGNNKIIAKNIRGEILREFVKEYLKLDE